MASACRSEHFDVIIIGGGAAGLMCAQTAGRRGRRVLLIEHTHKVGKKILMSGGGRCNFMNLDVEPEHYLSENPHFCKSALSRYTPWDFIALVEKHGVPYHEKTQGQLFCDRSAKDILNLLLTECVAANVEIRTRCCVETVAHRGCFQVNTSAGVLTADALVMATGGLSIPSMRTTPFGYEIAKQFGMKIIPTRPGLVPFTCGGAMKAVVQRLAGVSLAVKLSHGGQSFREAMLFTHRGISGPAALQLSNYWRTGDAISIDLLPDITDCEFLITAKRARPKRRLHNILVEHLPKNVVRELAAILWPTMRETAVGEIPDRALIDLVETLHAWSLVPSGTEGFSTAEVTLGGVDTCELSSKTMESKRQTGLYFIGEVVDVTGQLGGFNFQWAWASGNAAGEVV